MLSKGPRVWRRDQPGTLLRHSTTIVLVASFTVFAVWKLPVFLANPTLFFGDGQLYANAAGDWLAGHDPWSTTFNGARFAAPPPTLLVAAPFAPFGTLAGIATGFVCICAAIVAVRKLRLPFWWLAWPPILDAVVVANPDVIVLALLVIARPATDVVATLEKVYAAIPIGTARPRHLIPVVAGLALTAVILPWPAFFRALPDISATLAEQSGGGLSAYGNWPLFAITAVAVVSLRRDGGWVAVPALWPSTQLHYAAMSLHVAARSPLLALGLALPITYAPPIAVLAYAAVRSVVRPQTQIGDDRL
jgi:hypothetical protein